MEQRVPSRRIGSQAEVLAVAERLGYQHGVAGVTTRAIVHEAAVSRSSVGYHFRGRDGVLIALYRKLADDAAAWRRTRIEALRRAQAIFLTLPSVFAGLMTDLTTSGGPRTLLMEEIEDLAIRGTIKLAKDLREENRSAQEFWYSVVLQLGGSQKSAEIWRAMARGAIPTMLIEPDPAIRAAEFSVFAERLSQRLAGNAPKSRLRSEPLVLPEGLDRDKPGGKRQIIEAALQLIGNNGVPRLTHRQIAETAGLSVASTTYFFKNKGEIVSAAFRELLRRIMTDREGDRTKSQAISNAILTDDGELRWEANALLAWYLAAAREPAFRPYARDVQTRYWGIAAAPLLSSYGITEVDRIDGMLCTFVVNAAIADCRPLPKAKRVAFLERRVKEHLSTLFP